MLAGAAQAQSFDKDKSHLISHTSTGTIGRTVAGEITGDGRLDAAFLDGTEVQFAYSPDKHDSIVQANDSSSPANDIAILHGAGASDADDILLVGAQGLFRCSFDHNADPVFTITEIGWGAVETSDWNNASRVVTADLDHDGTDDVIGLNAAKTSYLVSYGPNYNSTITTSLGGAVALDVCAFDYSDGGANDKLELGFLVSGGGLFAVPIDNASAAGALFFVNVTGGSLVPIRDGAGNAERVAALALDGLGGEELVIWGAGGSESVPLTVTGGAYGIFAGDIDGDDDEDVGIAHTNDKFIYLFENQTGTATPTFSSTAGEAADMRLSYSNVIPNLGDYHGSGIADLFSFSTTNDEVLVYDNQNAGSFDQLPEQTLTTYFFSDPDGDGLNTQGWLKFDYDLSTYTVPATATDLEVIQWVQDEWGYGQLPSTPPSMEGDASYRDYIDSTDFQTHESFYVELDAPQSITTVVRHFEVRWVERDASGNILRSGPARTMAFSTNPPMTAELAAHYGGSISSLVIYVQNALGLWDIDSRPEEDGGSVDTPDIPDPDDPRTPNPSGGPPGGGGAGSPPGGN